MRRGWEEVRGCVKVMGVLHIDNWGKKDDGFLNFLLSIAWLIESSVRDFALLTSFKIFLRREGI